MIESKRERESVTKTGERDRRERVVKGTSDLNEGTKKTGKEKKEDRKECR